MTISGWGANGPLQDDLIQGLNGSRMISIADIKKVVGGIVDGLMVLKIIRSQ